MTAGPDWIFDLKVFLTPDVLTRPVWKWSATLPLIPVLLAPDPGVPHRKHREIGGAAP